MHSRALLLLLLSGLGCDGAKPAGDDTGVGDTDADTDTDTDTDADTDADTDTDTDTLVGSGDQSPLVLGAASGTAAFVADLDGDGRDELVGVLRRGGLTIARIDLDAASAVVATVAMEDVSWAYPAGPGQLVVRRGSEAASVVVATDGDGWSVVETPMSIVPKWIGAVGDLDGDGAPDFVLRDDDGGTWVVPGPFDPTLSDPILYTTDCAYTGYRTDAVATGDVDGDGADDLVAQRDDGELVVIYGPIARGTTGTLAGLAGTVIDLGARANESGLAVLDDLDGDGQNEVAVASLYDVLGFDGLSPGSTEGPEWVVQGVAGGRIASAVPALRVLGAEAATWLHSPEVTRYRPDTAVALSNDDSAFFGDFRGDGTLDVVWEDADQLLAAPGPDAPGLDLDRDGYAEEDCDDTNPELRPQAPEDPNGIDDDCDGTVDESGSSLPTPSVTYAGPVRDGAIGDNLAGFGSTEIVWVDPETPGQLVVAEPATGSVRSIVTLSVLDDRGAVAPAGDLDGDGADDLVALACCQQGQAFVFGPAGAETSVHWSGGPDYADFTAAGDLDGDGLGDFVQGGTSFNDDGSYAISGIQLSRDPRNGELEALWLDEAFGTVSAVGAADLDGDGHDDLVLNGLYLGDGAHTIGWWRGPLTDAPTGPDTWEGAVSGVAYGASALLADVDDDGAVDLVVGDAVSSSAAVYRGPLGSGLVDTADGQAEGEADSGFGATLAGGPGWLFVGAPRTDRGAGRVYGFVDGALATGRDGAAVRVDGPHPGAGLGYRLLAGDLDENGTLDLLIGAPGQAAPVDSEGGVSVFLGL